MTRQLMLGSIVLSCLLISLQLRAQEATNSDAGATGNVEDKPLELQATLLLISSDWTLDREHNEMPQAAEIRQEVAKALDGKPIPNHYRGDPAKHGAYIWFPDEHVTTYQPEELASLVAWLRKHKLLHGVHAGEPLQLVGPEMFGDKASVVRLSLGGDIIPISYHLPPQPEVPLVQIEHLWQWTAVLRTDTESSGGEAFNPRASETDGNQYRLTLDADIAVSSFYPTESDSARERTITRRYEIGDAEALERISKREMAVVPWHFYSPGHDALGIRPIVIIYAAPMVCPWLNGTDEPFAPALNLPSRLIPLAGSTSAQPAFNPHRAAQQPPDASGTPDLLQKPPTPTVESVLRVYPLRYAKVVTMRKAIEPLFRAWSDKNVVFSEDERVNILIVQAPEELHENIEVILKVLDVDQPPVEEATAEVADVSRMRDDYQTLNRRAQELARVARTRGSQGQDDDEFERIERELRQVVAQAFEARQNLQHAEIAALRQQLEELQQSVRARNELQEQIIERRIEELLQ